MPDEPTPAQILIDREVFDGVKKYFGGSSKTPVTWVFNHLGRMLNAGLIPLQALNPSKENNPNQDNSTK